MLVLFVILLRFLVWYCSTLLGCTVVLVVYFAVNTF